MKRLLLSFLFCIAGLRAADPAPVESPLQPLQFWVGGTWRGELPPGRDGVKRVLETTFAWMENKQALRFDTHSVAGERRSGYSSGIYGWHPGQKKIVFWYFDSAGTLYEGSVAVEGDKLIHDFTATDKAGKTAAYRAVITRAGVDAYDNAIFRQVEGKWEQFVTVRYDRRKD